ncbi:hypothetical protein GN244_ATG01373 [Phytophthora infestans]|uniref:Uncharacterized protein n=1 Tax=Phytophthora infestans TaxID=4787 RepID=A0A833SS83_PHYIN|nr:hypothetical protein GN244_ATG08412 [Phytophthora infestans]KAF4046223.1 hypothetical protein GN244_ATG01373 [Phytophthora infestans]
MMSALLRYAARRPATQAFRPAAQQQRSLWISVPEGQDASRVKRKRKNEEQNIRRANRRVGSMIDFILRRKKSGH